MKNLRRDAKVKSVGKYRVVAVMCASACVAIFAAGCTRNASSDWAQTAPIIKADATMGKGIVSLGARK